MSAARSVGGGTLDAESSADADHGRSRGRDHERDAWMAMMAAQVATEVRHRASGDADWLSPTTWRPTAGQVTGPSTTAGTLTPRTAPGDRESAAGAATSDAGRDGRPLVHGRLSLTVRAGDLGEIAMVLDRGTGGIHVRLAAQSDHAASALEAERGVLVAALRAVGLTVGSVQVARGDGTSLARSPSTADARSEESSRHYRRAACERDAGRKRGKRLDVVG